MAMRTPALVHIFPLNLNVQHDFQALNSPLPSRPVLWHGPTLSIVVPMPPPDPGGSGATLNSPSGLMNSDLNDHQS